jgi:hypothetical protein
MRLIERVSSNPGFPREREDLVEYELDEMKVPDAGAEESFEEVRPAYSRQAGFGPVIRAEDAARMPGVRRVEVDSQFRADRHQSGSNPRER